MNLMVIANFIRGMQWVPPFVTFWSIRIRCEYFAIRTKSKSRERVRETSKGIREFGTAYRTIYIYSYSTEVSECIVRFEYCNICFVIGGVFGCIVCKNSRNLCVLLRPFAPICWTNISIAADFMVNITHEPIANILRHQSRTLGVGVYSSNTIRAS